ncbi:MAG: DUF1549 domain-containing protein [Rhodopirellula sp.]|nr:DUF1549 domain-containing protein [Rhodopirellula sp.]
MTNLLQPSDLSNFVELLELQLEDRITPSQFQELEETIRLNREARQLYLRYVDLHGALLWDLALTVDADRAADELLKLDRVRAEVGASLDVSPTELSQRLPARWIAVVTAVCCVALVFVVSGLVNTSTEPSIAEVAGLFPEKDTTTSGGSTNTLVVDGDSSFRDIQPAQLPIVDKQPGDTEPNTDLRPSVSVAVNTQPLKAETSPSASITVDDSPADHSSTEPVVAKIDRLIRAGWADNEIAPSEKADNSEWLRRVYLDTVGHIPPAEDVRAFLADGRPDKRSIVVDALLDDEDYIRNWTTVWTNLLIGRSNPRQVNRAALQKYLRESFAENRGWDDIVTDFIAAEGSRDENGATNFLLAHVNNQAVPATAITGQVFLGLQLQCTQCHNHPFNNQKQDEFWAFNSFFNQIKVKDQPKTGNPELRQVALLNSHEGGPTFYETRQGLMKAVFPSFEGHAIDASDNVDRRSELARLMTEGDSPQIARAFVNRMWQHFFGAAFTPQVDDMGPHIAVSHPELLDELTRQFVRSGYDTKQLVRWICNSEAYNLTSRFNSDETNVGDDPTLGNEPLFSRVYVKQMQVEQLFDSLLIATQAHEVFGSTWEAVEERRQQWLQQFVVAWNTDENDEADLFDGTVPQALMMMNGDLVDLALKSDRGTLLSRVARSRTTENEKIETIALAALSRMPSRQEIAAVRKLIRDSVSRKARPADQQLAMQSGLQDLFWACLNSNEFILVH